MAARLNCLKRNAVALSCLICFGLASAAQRKHETPFGSSEPQSGALHGRIYSLPEKINRLPDFEALHPKGDFYAYSLTVKTQETYPWHGLPGPEWYALDYRGEFYVQKATHLRFFLVSDDGSKLYIDDECIIDNDGIHASQMKDGRVHLKPGMHRIRVSYFQGPAPYVALFLSVKVPGQDLKPFDMRDFAPPGDNSQPGLQERPQ
jgi:PA14 domain